MHRLRGGRNLSETFRFLGDQPRPSPESSAESHGLVADEYIVRLGSEPGTHSEPWGESEG